MDVMPGKRRGLSSGRAETKQREHSVTQHARAARKRGLVLVPRCHLEAVPRCKRSGAVAASELRSSSSSTLDRGNAAHPP